MCVSVSPHVLVPGLTTFSHLPSHLFIYPHLRLLGSRHGLLASFPHLAAFSHFALFRLPHCFSHRLSSASCPSVPASGCYTQHDDTTASHQQTSRSLVTPQTKPLLTEGNKKGEKKASRLGTCESRGCTAVGLQNPAVVFARWNVGSTGGGVLGCGGIVRRQREGTEEDESGLHHERYGF